MIEQLDIPDEVASDNAVEFVRAFASGDRVEFVTRGNVFEDPGFIGIFAADLVRHLIDSDDVSAENKDLNLKRAVWS